MSFKPAFLSFEQGIERLDKVLNETGIKRDEILTSHDQKVQTFLSHPTIQSNPLKETEKRQLPFSINSTGAQFFMTDAKPGVEVTL